VGVLTLLLFDSTCILLFGKSEDNTIREKRTSWNGTDCVFCI